MALVTSKEMFRKAYDGGYAIGAFNVNNMEIVQGITEALSLIHISRTSLKKRTAAIPSRTRAISSACPSIPTARSAAAAAASPARA